MFDIVSDLHFDNGMQGSPEGILRTIDVTKYRNETARVLIVAGDTAERERDAADFLNNAAGHYEQVIAVLGNHDRLEDVAPALADNVHVLDRTGCGFLWEGIAFVGACPLDFEAEAEVAERFAVAQRALDVERVVLVVHYVPSRRFSQVAGRDIDNKAIDLLERLEPVRKPTLLVFGHVHLRFEGEIDGMRFLSNPRGYRGKLRDGSFWAGRFLFEA